MEASRQACGGWVATSRATDGANPSPSPVAMGEGVKRDNQRGKGAGWKVGGLSLPS